MAKHRSPNCPQISFAEAIEKGRKVYAEEHTHPAAKEVVAKDLGYSGLNGRSLTLIGALRQYGILEGSSEALRVTRDAIAYFELDDGPEKTAAMRRMALAPDLFTELSKSHILSLPSDGNLRHELVGKGFSSQAADDVIKVYKANVQLATGEKGDYDEQEHDEEESSVMNPGTGIITPPKPTIPPASGVQTYAFALSPDARAELILKGSLTFDDLDLLRDHIELTIRALSKSAERMRKQKERIVFIAQALCAGCKILFEDYGVFIRFKVVKDGVELVPCSEDRPIAFYEDLSDDKLRERLKILAGGKL